MQHFKPRPAARIISPRAQVVLPLPLPVWTMSKPAGFFLVVFAAPLVLFFFGRHGGQKSEVRSQYLVERSDVVMVRMKV